MAITSAPSCATGCWSTAYLANLPPNPHQTQHNDFSRPFRYIARSGKTKGIRNRYASDLRILSPLEYNQGMAGNSSYPD